jgi:cytoskeletal protein RodZ
LQAAQEEGMAKGSFGERLKRERELREVTLAEITSATRIGPRFLEALENEEWEKLPGGVFNRGFVRSVARYLGLDEEALLGEYDLAHGAQVQAAAERPEKGIPAVPKWFPVVVLLGLLVVLAGAIAGGIYAWRRYSANRATKQSLDVPQHVAPANGSAGPAAGSPTNPAAEQSMASPGAQAAQPPLDLLVSLSATTHVRILADGKVLFDAELASGENRHFPAQELFEVTAGNSSAVLLELNGQTMPPLGAPGASGTIRLGRKDLKQAASGNSQP